MKLRNAASLTVVIAASVVVAQAVPLAPGGDWPQWRGPKRDGVSIETGLLPSWPASGPPRVWSANGLGRGFSSVSVAAGRIFTMGDRGNARVQVFDNNLVLRAIYDQTGNPWEICVSGGPHQYLFVSNSNPDSQPAASWLTSGEIYKMELDGKILGRFGKAGKGLGEFQTVHGLDCRNPNELYVGEISAWRVQKLVTKKGATATK